jgi:dienelactone hydrolase
MRHLFLCLLMITLFGEAAFAQVKPFPELVRMFDYDRQAPLDLKENSVDDRGGVKVHDITYASPKGGQVSAYLVVPSGRGPFAGLVFMHPDYGTRTAFLAEAVLLAETGAVSLLIDAPFRRPEPSHRTFDITKPENNRDVLIQTIIDLRRGVDLLTSRPEVDAKRLGFVGLSLGAHMGGILSGVEKRIKALVLMGGLPTLTERLRQNNKDGKFNHDIEILPSIDPIHYVSHAAPSALFFQFARRDRFVSEKQAIEYSTAASLPKLVKWYDTGHELNDIQALSDRADWLRQQIGIGPLAPVLRKKLG